MVRDELSHEDTQHLTRRMDKNESPFDLPLELKRKATERILSTDWNRYAFPYPDAYTEGVRARIASQFQLDSSNVLVGNGTADLIPAFFGLRKKIVTFEPTFELYQRTCQNRGLEREIVRLNDRFEIPDNLEVDKDALYVICSPNNPTGNVQPKELVEGIVEKGALCVIDEAYWEFSGVNFSHLVKDHDNVVILRTFSKAFGLAGLRFGYAVSSEKLIQEAVADSQPIIVSNVTTAIAETVMENSSYVDETVSYIKRERNRMYRELAGLAFPSQTNFLLVNLNCLDYMSERGIALRKLSKYLAGMVRVTVSSEEDNNAFLETALEFSDVPGEKGAA